MARNEPLKLVANNKKAYHDYFILERFECGIELFGTEVKSLRQGKCSIKEDPLRTRKLLLHKSEIMKLAGQIKEKGLTLVPLQVYFKNGRAKMEIGLARGKKIYDRREDKMKRDISRETERDYKLKLKG